MKFHILSIVISIQKKNVSAAEAKHEQHVKQHMQELKSQQALHCHLF